MLSHLIKFAVEGAAVYDSSFSSSFYVDSEDDLDESDELLFCKNNVCVHVKSALNDSHIPGYFKLSSKTRQSGHVRLRVTWIPNSFLSEQNSKVTSVNLKENCTNCKEPLISRKSPEMFNVDLSEMKTLRIFYDRDDVTCGQLVIGNLENHFKVFHFYHGGLDHIVQILEDWDWCSQVIEPLDQNEIRKKTFTIISKRILKQGFHPEEGRFDPMASNIWRTFFNESGQIEDVANFRKARRYFEPQKLIRKWKEKSSTTTKHDARAMVYQPTNVSFVKFCCILFFQTYFRELLRMLVPDFYAHLLLQDSAMELLFCHRWLLLSFKREFFNEEVLKMWEACWSCYQTEYFHIFLCVAMVQEYGKVVVEKDMQADDILQFFTDLSMKMDGTRVLRVARQLLLKFRQLPGIPCSLRGLLSGPGIWDSAPLPEIQCSCHDRCLYLDTELMRVEEKYLEGENENTKTPANTEERPANPVSDDQEVNEKLRCFDYHFNMHKVNGPKNCELECEQKRESDATVEEKEDTTSGIREEKTGKMPEEFEEAEANAIENKLGQQLPQNEKKKSSALLKMQMMKTHWNLLF
ncbi:PREDICTED: TBC1 domain family member 16-like [Acropora digitifera]|uniref:TBC1 domain family member 16-like n=1 Tax=Acropora digitifera TaxID=70779 RepID=UPI000779FAAA|nr:PREDICTED: TBC1 domain family member 16-like [Acropora digitifera]